MYMLYHKTCVEAALESRLTPFALDAVIGANFNCDLLGNIAWKVLEKKIFPLYPIAWIAYRKEVHLDESKNFDALTEAWRGRAGLLDALLDPSTPAPPKRIARTLGHATHSMADLYTHSNYPELLFGYYREQGVAEDRLAAHIAENGLLFSDVAAGGAGVPADLMSVLKEQMFSDQSLPDVGPRSHKEINKDTPKSPRCNDPKYPGIFEATFGLSKRDTVKLVSRFMDKLQASRPDALAALLAWGKEREMKRPGPGERRAKRLTDLVGTWD